MIGVCIITKHYYPKIGGAENQVDLFSRWLAEHNIPVMVITRRFDKSLPAHEMRHGVEVIRLTVLPTKLLGTLSFVVGAVRRMMLEQSRYNVIHAHQIFSPSLIGWLVSRLTGHPLVVNLHRGGPQGDVQLLMRRPLIGRWRMKSLIRDTGSFIAISEEIANELRGEGVPEKKIARMDNAVNEAIFHPVEEAERCRLRTELGLPEEGPIGIYCGRLVEIKGVNDLILAWQHVSAPAHLVIVGDGEERDTLEALAEATIAERVTFMGVRHDVPNLLKAADVWVLPSYGEGLPVSLLEAMACGLPVITTPVGAIPDVVTDGENGYLVEPGNVEQLAQMLNRVFETDVHVVGQHARETVLNRFGIDTVAANYVALFESLG